MSREIMQQALDALLHMCNTTKAQNDYNAKIVDKALVALESALAQPEPVQVRPHEFIAMASKQANMIGKPVVWAEYPTPHKIILDEGWEWGHEARAKEALAQPEQEVSYTDIQMAELIMSDCGHSSEYKPLLDRIAGRLATYRQELAQQEQRAAWQGNGGAGYNVGGTGVAKPEQEPVRWFQQFGDAPPKREWVGLTDDEINKIVDLNTSDDSGFDIWCDGIAVAHIVCAKLKEKNA